MTPNRAPSCLIFILQEATDNVFEFISDSADVMDSTLRFYLDSYSAMTAIEMKFPVGETYKFSLELYDSYNNDPVSVIGVRTCCRKW